MRIAMFSRIMPAHSPGGMQDHVQTLSAGLVQRGHEVVVITSGRNDGKTWEEIQGIQVHFLSGTPPGRNTNAYWFGAAEKLEQLHTAKPFDILHSQSVGAYGVYKRGLNHKYHVPLITSFHGTHLDVLTTTWHTDFSLTHPFGMARFFALTGNLFFRYWYRDVWFTRASDIVIATSDADVGKYQMLYRLPLAQIRTVYNGIDTDLFSPTSNFQSLRSLKKSLRIDDDAKILLALARLEKDKGVQNAIAVMPRLLQKIRVRLIVVGDGVYRKSLESLARNLGVAEHVTFVGAKTLAECAQYFNLCDIFVDPTLRTDGYDLTIAEAMACCKPVIVSDVGANSTLIDRQTMCDGILIPRGDNDALLREILRLLGDPGLGESMGRIAREKMVARFSIAAMVQGMEAVYKEQLRV